MVELVDLYPLGLNSLQPSYFVQHLRAQAFRHADQPVVCCFLLVEHRELYLGGLQFLQGAQADRLLYLIHVESLVVVVVMAMNAGGV